MMNENVRDTAAPALSSSQLIRCAKILKMIALKLGKTEDSAEYDKDIKRVGDALNKYSWDEESGYYSYVLHNEQLEPTGKFLTRDGEDTNFVIVNDNLSEQDKLIALIHEFVHLYRNDLDSDKDRDELEREVVIEY